MTFPSFVFVTSPRSGAARRAHFSRFVKVAAIKVAEALAIFPSNQRLAHAAMLSFK